MKTSNKQYVMVAFFQDGSTVTVITSEADQLFKDYYELISDLTLKKILIVQGEVLLNEYL